jgi:hypothetical protein
MSNHHYIELEYSVFWELMAVESPPIVVYEKTDPDPGVDEYEVEMAINGLIYTTNATGADAVDFVNTKISLCNIPLNVLP